MTDQKQPSTTSIFGTALTSSVSSVPSPLACPLELCECFPILKNGLVTKSLIVVGLQTLGFWTCCCCFHFAGPRMAGSLRDWPIQLYICGRPPIRGPSGECVTTGLWLGVTIDQVSAPSIGEQLNKSMLLFYFRVRASLRLYTSLRFHLHTLIVGISRLAFGEDWPTRLSRKSLQYKSVKPRVSHTSVRQGCPTTVFHLVSLLRMVPL